MYLEIQKWLRNLSYWKLLITSKNLFEKIRYETRIICLQDDENNEEIRRFFIDENYRKRYLDKIQSPSNQLRLKVFSTKSSSLFTSEVLCSLIKCDIDLRIFEPHQDIDNYEAVFSISNLNGRRRIYLHCLKTINNFDGLIGVEDMRLVSLSALISVNALKNLCKLCLMLCHNVTDISCLGRLLELRVINCQGVSTTLGIGNIPFLYLDLLENLITLDPLTKNEKLTIRSCNRVVDRSPLRNVLSLHTDLFTSFQDCENLLRENKRLESIFLVHYREKEPHPCLNRLKSVSFIKSSIDNLKYLKDVPKLSFSACEYLNDLNDISGSKTKSISFVYCHKIQDFTPIHGIPSIRIHTASNDNFLHSFSEIPKFSNTTHLSLGCDSVFGTISISMKGIETIHHLEVKNICLVDLPPGIPIVEITGEDFIHAARTILEQSIMSSRIILKERIYEAFVREFRRRKKFFPSLIASPFEILIDPAEKQVVLLKNDRYQQQSCDTEKKLGEIEESLSSMDKLFYKLFAVLPPDTQGNL